MAPMRFKEVITDPWEFRKFMGDPQSLQVRMPTRLPPRSVTAFEFLNGIARCDPVRSVIERLEKMRRRVFADAAAERGTHLGAVAPVHPAPHTRIAFLGLDGNFSAERIVSIHVLLDRGP